ncbi:MAG TPA: hypothetical protein VMW43_05420 [Bacteroidota bacterium]|nr:hypothetical protein [Bacteroidota bacterium]
MGRSAILMVMGLSLVLLMATSGLKRDVNLAYENYLTYTNSTHAHNIALSAANMGANAVFMNNAWTTGYSGVSYDGGTFDVTVTNPTANQTKITSVGHLTKAMLGGNLVTINDTVQVLLQPSTFSKFGVYINNMSGVAWATGDTVWGPCHIEGTMNVLGTPVFYGKVTTKSGTNPAKLPAANATPKFYGTYQSGVSVPLPTNFGALQTAASSGGKLFTPPGSPAGAYSVNMTLLANGQIHYQEYKGATKVSDVTTALTTLAPNGAIVVSGGDINLQGTINGQATIGSIAASGNGGNVHIVGNIKYNNDPQTNPASTDMLGIVADNNVDIPLPSGYPSTAAPHDYLIEAAVFARTGNFSAAYTSSMGKLGAVTLYGSLVTNTIGAFAAGDANGNVLYGYSNKFNFDERLMVGAPPAYPTTGTLEVISWKE